MMTLPDSCIECNLASWSYSTCNCPLLEKVWDDNGTYSDKRRRGCPLPKILKPKKK